MRYSARTFPTLRQVVPRSDARFRLATGLLADALVVFQSQYPVALVGSMTGGVGAIAAALSSTSPGANRSTAREARTFARTFRRAMTSRSRYSCPSGSRSFAL